MKSQKHALIYTAFVHALYIRTTAFLPAAGLEVCGPFPALSNWVKRMMQISSIRHQALHRVETWISCPCSHHTYRGEGLDFKPSQNARQLVGGDVSGPLDPHVLSGEKKKMSQKAAGGNNNRLLLKC